MKIMTDTSKTLTIVTSSHTSPGAVSLLREAQKLGIEARIKLIQDTKSVCVAINSADIMIYRIKSATYPLYEQLVSSIEVDKRAYLQSVIHAFDKIDTNEVLERYNIAHPSSHCLERSALSSVEKFPFVLKIANGNQGKGVALVKSSNDITDFLEEFPEETRFLLQEYVAESKGSDKRLFVVSNKVVAAMTRRAQTDDFRANIHLGGRAEQYIPTPEEEALAIETSRRFGLIFAGVDIIDSSSGPLVLEINSSPGFEISNVTGVNVAELVVKNLLGVNDD